MDSVQQAVSEGWLLMFDEAGASVSAALDVVLRKGASHLGPQFAELRRRNLVIVPFSVGEPVAARGNTPASAVLLQRVLARAWTRCGERRPVLLGVGSVNQGILFVKGAVGASADFWGVLGTGEGGVIWLLPDGATVVGSGNWPAAARALDGLLGGAA